MSMMRMIANHSWTIISFSMIRALQFLIHSRNNFSSCNLWWNQRLLLYLMQLKRLSDSVDFAMTFTYLVIRNHQLLPQFPWSIQIQKALWKPSRIQFFMPALNTSTCVIISSEMLSLRANCLWDISLEMRIPWIFLRRVLIATSMQLLLACFEWLDVCVELNLFSLFIFYLFS